MSQNIKTKGLPQFYYIYIVLIHILIQTYAIDVCAKKHIRKYEGITIYQNGIEVVGRDNIFYMDTAAFSIHFYNKMYDADNNKFYAARLVAEYSEDQIPTIKPGLSINSIPCFMPGTGLAANASYGYTSLTMSSTAHHYLYYQDEEHKRVNKIGEKKGYSLFEFSTDSLNFWGEYESMQQTKVSQFYLALLIDRNLNGMVDEGEYQIITIRIKENYKGWNRCYWNIQDEKGVTTLQKFLSFQKWKNVNEQTRLKILKEALSCNDINLNLTDEFGYTALHYAISTHYITTSNICNYDVKRNSYDIIKTMLDKGHLDINKRDFGYMRNPFLTFLIEENDYNSYLEGRFDSIINLFLRQPDLDLTSRDNVNLSAFYYKEDLTERLNDTISDFIYNDNASWEMIKIIDQLGYNETLDDSSFFKKNINICFDYNADPNFYNDTYNYTPLIWLCSTTNRPYGYSQEEIYSNMQIRDYVLKLFLHNPLIDVNIPNDTGNTPLHIAARDFNYLLIKSLLQDEKTDVNRVNDKGNTPLMALLISFKYCFFKEQELQCLQTFIDHKEKLNFKIVNYKGNTIVDIINKELLVDVTKDWLKKKHPDIFEEIINLRDYAINRMNEEE